MADTITTREARRVAPLVSAGRLTFARELQGWTQKELVQHLVDADHPISAPALSQLERGHHRPSPETLAALCGVYGCPPDFFIERPGDESLPGFFRSLAATPARDRKLYIARARLLRSFVQKLEEYVVLPEVDLPRRPVQPDELAEAEAAAERLRKEWAVPAGPVDNVVRLLEQHGIIVVRPKQLQRKIDAFSVRYDERPLVVLSAAKQLETRSRFDAAHELGHLLMHDNELAGSSAVERHAHAFAAAFLMPADDIVSELPRSADMKRLIELKVKWRVSMSALLMRAKTLEVIAPEKYTSAMKMFSARGWRKSEPGDELLGPVETPRMLAQALTLVQEEEGLTVRDLCREGALPYEQIRDILSRTRDTRPVVEL